MNLASQARQAAPLSAQPVTPREHDRTSGLADHPVDRAALIERAQRDRQRLGPREVVQLQRLIGNQAVTRLLAPTKLPGATDPRTEAHQASPSSAAISSANDQVVQRVVAMPNPIEAALLGQTVTFLQNQKNLIASKRQRQQASRIRDAWYVVVQGANANIPATGIVNYINNNAPHPNRVSTQQVIAIFTNASPGVTFGQVPNLVAHLNPLFQALIDDIAEGWQGPGEGIGHQYTSGNPGQAGNAECRRAGNVTGLNFAQIGGAATGNGGQFVIDEIGQNLGARSRLLWRWADLSELVIDLPGMGAHETYEVSYTPHAHLIAPDGVHLDAVGVGVPASSQPAHIIIEWKHNSLKDFIKGQQGFWHYVGK